MCNFLGNPKGRSTHPTMGDTLACCLSSGDVRAILGAKTILYNCMCHPGFVQKYFVYICAYISVCAISVAKSGGIYL